jgi:hypothetical protein
MSMIAMNASAATIFGGAASDVGDGRHNDVVEINLLLPSRWADEIIQLSRERQQTVAQVLRSMIGRALHESDPDR